MALIKCKECGAEISDQAEKCPRCGASVPKGTSRLKILLVGVLVIVIGKFMFSPDTPPSTPAHVAGPPSAADQQHEKNFQTVVAGARWIKNNMKNPASFELVSAMMIGNDAICYEYRGTNSFNAVVLNYRVITNTENSDDAGTWNKRCAGKPGVDFTPAAKFAM